MPGEATPSPPPPPAPHYAPGPMPVYLDPLKVSLAPTCVWGIEVRTYLSMDGRTVVVPNPFTELAWDIAQAAIKGEYMQMASHWMLPEIVYECASQERMSPWILRVYRDFGMPGASEYYANLARLRRDRAERANMAAAAEAAAAAVVVPDVSSANKADPALTTTDVK